MRADFSGLRVFQTRARSAIASRGARTSRVTVLTVPPFYVAFKVSDQFLGALEGIGGLLRVEVPVIALPSLIVVADNTNSVYNIGQSILELVC
jgi:hypothetical protein